MGFRKIAIFPCNILVLHKLSSSGKENHLSRNEKLTDENRDSFERGGGEVGVQHLMNTFVHHLVRKGWGNAALK